MNSTASVASFATVRPRITASISPRAVVVFGAVACVVTFLLNVFWRESYTGDEGFYGVTAQNMLHGWSYWLRPSYFPLGDFLADKDGFAHPPFNSYLYAVGLWLTRGSVAGPEVINLIALAGLLFGAYRLLARVDASAAKIAVVALAASPAIRGYYSMLEAEPLLTTCGVLGMVSAAKAGFEPGRRRWLFLAGLCLGLAFALKLWLCGPIALAMGVALLLRAWASEVPWSHYAIGAAWFVLGAVIPAGAHLAAIALFYPADLKFWFHNIYFGIFAKAGISGSKFEGNAIPANWVHPIWYYGAALYRDHFFLVPPIAFGMASAWRESRRYRRLLLVLGAGVAGVVPLSLIKVKEPLYVLTSAVFIYLLAAVCVAALVRRVRSRSLDRLSLGGGVAVTGVLLLAVPAAFWRGVQPENLTPAFVAAHSVVMAGFLAIGAASVWFSAGRGLERALFWAGAVALAITVSWTAATHAPRDAVIAQLVKPYLAGIPPQEVAMVASNFKSFQYYTFAKGCYWHDLDLHASPDALLSRPGYADTRVFILSPEDQAKPENGAWLRWLAANANEKTSDVDRATARQSGYRVFVRGGAGLSR